MIKTQAYAVTDAKSPLQPYTFEREGAAANEVEIDVLFCDVCRSDVHQVKNERSNTVHPCVPGHEVVAEDFMLKIPATLKPEIAAPILCAGVTTYSSLRFWNVKLEHKVGIIGFGGLGHMAIQIARTLGADVTVFTPTKEKLEETSKFGAAAVKEDDNATFASLQANFDFMLSTVPEKHDLNPFIPPLKRNCTICAVGALESMAPLNNMQGASQRKQVTGSLIGSIAETQDVLDFCGTHGIGPEVDIIDMKDINIAYEKVASGAVRFRFVIDIASLKEA